MFVGIAPNVLQLTDSFCFSQKFWLGAVSGALAFTVKLLKKKKGGVREPFKL